MTSRILLAYPEAAASEARRVAAELGALGYEVGPLSPRSRGDKVVMLWSRAAWGTPALRAAARRAHAAGKLVCIRLDAAPPPVSGARTARLPRGRADSGAWRRLLNPKAQPLPVAQKDARRPAKRATRTPRQALAPSAPKPATAQESVSMKEKNSRGFAIALTLTLLAIGATGYAYQHDTGVAAQIDGAATRFYDSASALAALAP